MGCFLARYLMETDRNFKLPYHFRRRFIKITHFITLLITLFNTEFLLTSYYHQLNDAVKTKSGGIQTGTLTK